MTMMHFGARVILLQHKQLRIVTNNMVLPVGIRLPHIVVMNHGGFASPVALWLRKPIAAVLPLQPAELPPDRLHHC